MQAQRKHTILCVQASFTDFLAVGLSISRHSQKKSSNAIPILHQAVLLVTSTLGEGVFPFVYHESECCWLPLVTQLWDRKDSDQLFPIHLLISTNDFTAPLSDPPPVIPV